MQRHRPTFLIFFQIRTAGFVVLAGAALTLLSLLLAACNANRDMIFSVVALPAGAKSVAADGGAETEAGGQTGGSGSNAGTGGAGGPQVAHLDPDAVFEWAETAPGRGTCQPQIFVGSFACDVSPVALDPHVTGSLTLTFGGSSESQILGVTGAQLDAFDDSNQQLLKAPITGALDCGTHIAKLNVTRTTTSSLTLLQQIAWLQPTKSTFDVTGTLQGSFDPNTLSIAGTVSLMFIDTKLQCTGTFNVRTNQ